MSDPYVSQLIEKQMRNWELARTQRPPAPPEERPEVEDFVCLSRRVGLDPHPVAEILAQELGWPIFDREIFDEMAGDNFDRKVLYSSMDQRDLSWSEELIRGFFDTKFVKNDYFHRLCETVLLLARKGNALFLGRGADLILPREYGFRVRLTAPEETRVAAMAAARGLSPEAARAEIQRIEAARAQFFERHFRVASEEPARFDVTINLESFTAEQAVELILKAREVKKG